MRTVIPVNPTERHWTTHRYLLWFGATYLLVWGKSLESALDEAIDWIEEHAPGLLCDDSVTEAYEEAIAEGCSEEEAIERAEADTTRGGNAGHFVDSEEWGIVAEDPTRGQILEFQGRVTDGRTVDRFTPPKSNTWLVRWLYTGSFHKRVAARSDVARRFAVYRAGGLTAHRAYQYAISDVSVARLAHLVK